MNKNVLYRLYRNTSETTETCFYVECNQLMSDAEYATLRWLLGETYEPEKLRTESWFASTCRVKEVGPRLSFATPFSTNATSICQAIGLLSVKRLERSRVLVGSDAPVHDRMTEMIYPVPLETFDEHKESAGVFTIPLLERGPDALREFNRAMGLAMDEADIGYCYSLFANGMGRNPTNVEVMQVGVANSEHCRHWVFNAKIVINDEEMPMTLFQLVKAPLKKHPDGSMIAFSDNSSAIQGWEQTALIPSKPGKMCAFTAYGAAYSILFTAETHNFPTGIAPFPGAETGTGGRIRDVQATGRGGLVVAATTGYCVAGLNFGDYKIPSTDDSFVYPVTLASPLDILIQGSNGASDYGNKFGEPVITGFCRNFDLRVYGGEERRAWLKPILFTGGIGLILQTHCTKHGADVGMLIVQIGGPAYRIGMGGGSASSMIQGANKVELDFNAVQRGDAEMGRKGDRVIRACIEMGVGNPIESIHDQGAGGPCNVLTELVNPTGGRIEIRHIVSGDKTLSVAELWLAEYQERNGLLLRPENLELFQTICHRERVNCEVLGAITDDGRIVLHDAQDDSEPVNLELAKILGKLPQKVFQSARPSYKLDPLQIPNLTMLQLTEMTFSQLSVGSKGFLVHKVDRSVTGLVAQQQCCGPFQLPVCDVAVIAGNTLTYAPPGAATAIGEQPIKMLINRAAGARMAVAEAVTNLAAALIDGGLWKVKCSANEMWAAKQPGEFAGLYDAVKAMSDFMCDIGIAIDGGKDSLSMAANVGDETIKAPGQIVVSLYAKMIDATSVVTPDIKYPDQSILLLVHLNDEMRLGGSALAQALGQLGDEVPDIEDAGQLINAFISEQHLLRWGFIRAYHDRSDGGLLATVAEMIMSAGCGCELSMPDVVDDSVAWLFNEEFGMVIEVLEQDLLNPELQVILASYDNVRFTKIGKTTYERKMVIKNSLGEVLLDVRTSNLRDMWERTNDEIEKRQMNPECAKTQIETRRTHLQAPAYRLTYNPIQSLPYEYLDYHPKVAIIREEGSNGDREMAAAFHLAGFEVWDITMTDLLEGDPDMLEDFRGIAFVGGFSYADALDSAKGWAGVIRFNPKLSGMFVRFFAREDTFSLGVCNGCQLMTLLGIVPWQDIGDRLQPRFVHNASGRFESRWSMVRIERSPAMMLKGMAGSILGIPVAHGEGKLLCPDPQILEEARMHSLTPIVYVDDIGNPTGLYPFNPNGSPGGITALCDPSGRHLAMMPHPERAFWMWQWHYVPEFMKVLQASPWMRMFQNAYEWCRRTATS